MRISAHVAIVAIVVLVAMVVPTLGQLDPSKSYFLLTGQVAGSLTLASLSEQVNNLTLPAHTETLPIQALTDIVNKRFVILSGLEVSGGINYTYSNVSYSQFTISHLNSFVVPSDLHLLDATYDLSLKQPVALITNATNCYLMIGYGPAPHEPLPLQELHTCTNATTVGSILAGFRIVTVHNREQNGRKMADFCAGDPTTPLNCQTDTDTVVSNLIGATQNPVFFPTVFTKNEATYVGIYSSTSGQMKYLGQLRTGSVANNDHMPTYWDPVHLVFAGAWKTGPNQIQIFAATHPTQGWFSPPPGLLPQGNLIGLALAYKPVFTPVATPQYQPPTKAPSSKTGIIVGSVIGAIAAFALFIGIAIFVRKSFSFQYRKIPDYD